MDVIRVDGTHNLKPIDTECKMMCTRCGACSAHASPALTEPCDAIGVFRNQFVQFTNNEQRKPTMAPGVYFTVSFSSISMEQADEIRNALVAQYGIEGMHISYTDPLLDPID